MPLPTFVTTTTCDLYRPFGAASPLTTGIACRLVPDLAVGRGMNGALLSWTHYLDMDATVDVRDGCTRLAGADSLQFADGDELRIPNGSGSRYVAVWVEWHNRDTPQQFKRVYLLRAVAVWPGP